MIRLQLNDGEARLLQEILESTLADLSYEIADTDVKSYRDDLKARREVLRQLTAGLVEELEGGRTVD